MQAKRGRAPVVYLLGPTVLACVVCGSLAIMSLAALSPEQNSYSKAGQHGAKGLAGVPQTFFVTNSELLVL